MSVKSYALTTRQRLIDFLGLNSGSLSTAQQNVLDRIIDAATEYIQNQLGYKVQKTTYTEEVYSADGSNAIVLKARPIVAGQPFALQQRESVLNEDDWSTLDSKLYSVDNPSGIIRGMGSYKFRSGQAGFRVTYTAGFDFDNNTTFLSDTAGGDLEYAMWKLCADAYLKRKDSGGVTSESIGDYSVSFSKTAWEDETVRSILDRYAVLEFGAGLTPTHY